MARPRAELPEPAAIRSLADAQGRLALRVTPGARVEALTIEADRLTIKVRAKPSDGEANKAVLSLLAKALAVPVSHLVLLRGAASRDKLINIGRHTNE